MSFYQLSSKVRSLIIARELQLMSDDTGNQTDPKSIIEWCDVEDETRKLDSYSLKVRSSILFHDARLKHRCSLLSKTT